jgi:endonuclease YncB( thermonuclease family)
MNRTITLILGCYMLGLGVSSSAQKPEKMPPPQPVAKMTEFPPKKGVHLVILLKAIDGDTVDFAWLVPDRGRLAGINAPELHDPGGADARMFLGNNLPAKPVAVEVGPDKYGRVLMNVYLENGKTLSDVMVEGKHAKRWDGRGERP